MISMFSRRSRKVCRSTSARNKGLPCAYFSLNHGVEGGGLLAMTVACTVTVSIVAHGITANPLARRLGPRMKSGAG